MRNNLFCTIFQDVVDANHTNSFDSEVFDVFRRSRNLPFPLHCRRLCA